ncbi:MAG: hypothetical protein ABJZ55_01815 [Fuerstiella sp.]
MPAFRIPAIEETVAKEQRSTRWFWLIFFAAILIGFIGAKLFWGSNGAPDPNRIRLSKWQKLLMVPVFPVGTFLAILAHELGHVVGGKFAGLKFLLLVVGPLKVTRASKGLEWRVNRTVALMGGLACCVPTNPKQFLQALRWMIIGGPLASVLLMIVCYVGSLYATDLPLSATWALFAKSVLKIIALISMMIAFITIYPGAGGGLKTDGRQFLELLKSNPSARRQNLVRLLVGQSLAGIRPAEWESDVVQELDDAYLELEDDKNHLPERITWSSLRSAIAVDRNEIPAAYKLIQFNLDHATLYPVFARGMLFLEAAQFEARIRNDAEAAEALIEAAPEGMLVESYLRPAAQAEVSCLRGDREQAKTFAQQALDETASALDAGGAVMARERLLAIINETNA